MTESRQGILTYVAWAVLINVPFALCHPGGPVVDCSWIRSLVVGGVLFLLPGLPWVGIMVGRRWLQRFGWLWAVVISLAVMIAVIVVVKLTGLPLRGSTVWNVTWLFTNVAVGLGAVLRGPPGWGIDLHSRVVWFGVVLFLAAHLLFFYSATHVVPPMEDQDFQLLSCGYGFLTRFEPLQAIFPDTYYQFAHPPLVHWYMGCSFLCFDRLEYLEFYDAASRRARAAHLGIDFEWFDGTVGGLEKGTAPNHRVIGLQGTDYVLDPVLNDGTRRLPVWLVENAAMVEYYERDPQLLATRTPNIFLAALTVSLLGCWIGQLTENRLTGSRLLAVLIPLAYSTSPEVFVRSGYGGYFSATVLAALLLLMVLQQRPAAGSRRWWIRCFVAAGFLGLVNHKLILLPAAVVIWEFVQSVAGKSSRRPAAALLHPAALGFAAAISLFWIWGLSVDAAEFWQNHFRAHFFDRMIHHNPYDFGKLGAYPGVAGLWREFWEHTGYVLLPLGVFTLAALALQGGDTTEFPGQQRRDGDRPGFSPGLWITWTLIMVLTFSWVDWRQTKHLSPLFLPLLVAPALWASRSKLRIIITGVLLVGLTAWNLCALCGLAEDFARFSITPAW